MSQNNDTASVASQPSTRHAQSESSPDDTGFESDSKDVRGGAATNVRLHQQHLILYTLIVKWAAHGGRVQSHFMYEGNLLPVPADVEEVTTMSADSVQIFIDNIQVYLMTQFHDDIAIVVVCQAFNFWEPKMRPQRWRVTRQKTISSLEFP